MKLKLLLALVCLFSFGCGSQSEKSLPEVARNPLKQPPQPMTKAELKRRCAMGNINRVPGTLLSDGNICLIQTGEFVEKDYVVNNFIEDEDEVLMAAQAGSVVYGNFEGGPENNGPEIVIGSTIIGKGQIPVTRVPLNGRLRLRIYGGAYKSLSYFAGYCFGLDRPFVECPIPLNP